MATDILHLDPQFESQEPPTKAHQNANFVPLMVRRSFIWSYRLSAIFILYGVLLLFFGYLFLLGFYAVNSSWVAPLIISPADDKSLDLTVKMVQTTTAAQTLELDVKKLQASLPEFIHHRSALLSLEPQIVAALIREHDHNTITGDELAQLNAQKNLDNGKTDKMMSQIHQVEQEVARDLKAGMITKGEAAMQLTALNQAETTFTDSRITEVTMKDQILQKSTTSTLLLDTLNRQAELISEVSQLDVTISAANRQIETEREQIKAMYSAVEIAKQTPYYLAMTRGRSVNFAFIPYSNKTAAKLDSPVYDCYLNMVVCRRVGKIVKLFSEEEHAVHPLFRTDMRGFLVQIELSNPRSAESETMMLNHKPLLF